MHHGAVAILTAAIALSACTRPEPASDVLPPPPDPTSSATQSADLANVDATGVMACSLGDPTLDRSCAWEVTRTQPGQLATIAVDPPEGGRTILNYVHGEFSSPQGQVQWDRDGDFWFVNVADQQFYRFSDALISGG